MHRRDPAGRTELRLTGKQVYRVGGGIRSAGPGSTAGLTVCGRPMLLEELWCAHVPEPRDPLCTDCFSARLTPV